MCKFKKAIKFIFAAIGIIAAAFGVAYSLYKRLKPKSEDGYIEYEDENCESEEAQLIEFEDIDPATV